MRHHREDVVEQALAVLDAYGLADLTMRRLAAELDVRPSALYHHVASKQVLLAAVADEILARGPWSDRGDDSWDAVASRWCRALRDSMLAYRDGAELVATVHAFGLASERLDQRLAAALSDTGLDPELAALAARTLLYFVFGHVGDEQTHLQAGSAGAIDDEPRPASDFDLGLAIVVDGIRARVLTPRRAPR